MTRRPIESHDVEGFDGPEYETNILCGAPGCLARADDPHHIWRRSFLGGAYNWVKLEGGLQVGNIVNLCREHHDEVTNDKVNITFEGTTFFWNDLIEVSRPMAFQPPVTFNDETIGPLESLAEKLSPVLDLGFENSGEKIGENECPTCHQPFPKPKVDRPKEQQRIRRTWSITIPMDDRENGAQNLDEKLEEGRLLLARRGLHYDPIASTRFTVLDTMMSLFVLHFDEIMADA